jgi:hypothetical protein
MFLGEMVERTQPVIPRKSLVPFGGKSPEYMSTAQSSFKPPDTATLHLKTAGCYQGVSSEAGITNYTRGEDIISGTEIPRDRLHVPVSFGKRALRDTPLGNQDPITFLTKKSFNVKTTYDIVQEGNRSVPTLRSLASMRP